MMWQHIVHNDKEVADQKSDFELGVLVLCVR